MLIIIVQTYHVDVQLTKGSNVQILALLGQAFYLLPIPCVPCWSLGHYDTAKTWLDVFESITIMYRYNTIAIFIQCYSS